MDNETQPNAVQSEPKNGDISMERVKLRTGEETSWGRTMTM